MEGGKRLSLTRIPRLRPAAWATVAVVVAVNVVILLAYLLSRGGQTIDVRIEVRGTTVTAFVDGRQSMSTDVPTLPPSGGIAIGIGIGETASVPSLPTPRGLDSVRVTDLQDGRTLFEDDFEDFDKSRWTGTSGDLRLDDGHIRADAGPGELILTGAGWTDYAVDVRYSNITSAEMRVRFQEDRDGVQYFVRPFRNRQQGMSATVDGKSVLNLRLLPLERARAGVIRSLLAMLLRPYPALLALAIAACAAIFALQFVPIPSPPQRLRRLWAFAADAGIDPALLLLTAIAGNAFGTALILMYFYNSHIPHVPDEVSYLFQARVFASGHLAAPAPPVAESFNFFNPNLVDVVDGAWASIYPFGHSLVLALGIRVGAVWLVPPLVGAACVLVTFALARTLYNTRTALLAAMLLAASPFFLMTASNFMSHNTAALYMLAAMLCMAIAPRRPVLFPLLAGIFFGLLVNTRPFTGVALVPALTLAVIPWVLRARTDAAARRSIAALAVGGLVLAAALLLYNHATLGDALALPQAQSNVDTIGFAGAHSVSGGIANDETQLALLLLVFQGWPSYFGLIFVVAPFLLGSRRGADWLLLLGCACIMGAYTLYYADGIMHGPRYWYETLPILVLLTARGADRLAAVAAESMLALRRRVFPAHAAAKPALAVAVAIVYAAVALPALYGSYRWLRTDDAPWQVRWTPANASQLRGFNKVDDTLLRRAQDADLHNALLLTTGEACYDWPCYASLFWLNAPRLDGDVVYARDLPGRNAELFAAFPDRMVYTIEGPSGFVAPYGGRTDVPQDQETLAAAPPARDISAEEIIGAPTAEVTASPTAEVIASPTAEVIASPMAFVPAARDLQRAADLAEIAGMLRDYRRKLQSYPASSLDLLCYSDRDAGCVLEERGAVLPLDPLTAESYLYESDGQTFTLIAVTELAPPPSECPLALPRFLARQRDRIYCVTGDQAD